MSKRFGQKTVTREPMREGRCNWPLVQKPRRRRKKSPYDAPAGSKPERCAVHRGPVPEMEE